MSAIFGTCLSRGHIIDKQVLTRQALLTEHYGPDGAEFLIRDHVAMGAQAFHTHRRSTIGHQLETDPFGNILGIDGRIDNHRELKTSLGLTVDDVSDCTLILSAFVKWKEECFSRLVGDWALALWSAQDEMLYLARDHAGARALYYSHRDDETSWSTYLESFVPQKTNPSPEDDYIARRISYRPLNDLTPLKGVFAVKPAHYIRIQKNGMIDVRRHWHSAPKDQIVYRDVTQYDEHFISLFEQAVMRRCEEGPSVLAELSGGMDSTSIVCVADRIAASKNEDCNKLDTLSFFDNREPDWDETPYFTAVERFRNKIGIHVDCSKRVPTFEPFALENRVYPYFCGDSSAIDAQIQFEQSIGSGKYRVILSGMGGDELLGGVPTALPELADHLYSGHWLRLVSRAAQWGLSKRMPLAFILRDALFFAIELYYQSPEGSETIPPWLSSKDRHVRPRAREHTSGVLKLLGTRPSAVLSGQSWPSIVETLPHLVPPLVGCYEYRYPYLDRDLVDFLLRVPREQLVGPGRRRLLMRRALKGIIPDLILERRRKAFVSHGPITHLRASQQKIETVLGDSQLALRGLIDASECIEALGREIAGEVKWVGHLTRTIEAEMWLRRLTTGPVVSNLLKGHQTKSEKICPIHFGQTSSA